MNLVQYSDSESSDHEPTKPVPTKTKPATTTTTSSLTSSSKPAFAKVVDPANRRRIRVTLPTTTADADGEADSRPEVEEPPPAKKARRQGGMFGGFNAMLPTPKRTGLATGIGGGGGGGGGEGRHVVGQEGKTKIHMKTSATPAFSRGVEPAWPDVDEEPSLLAERRRVPSTEDGHGPTRAHGGISSVETIPSDDGPETVVKPAMKATMFKPLSVARKPLKKTVARTPATVGPTGVDARDTRPATKPRATLFSMHISDAVAPAVTSTEEYKPMIYSALPTPDEPPSAGDFPDPPVAEEDDLQPVVAGQPDPQCLDSIAADLGLSDAAKRQLFGRQAKGARRGEGPAVNVIRFNTDQEYAANEALRAAGETVQHNPVRAIAPGKHSLKQLINAASNQKEALEEHFAAGRRNKKEAGSRYGW
ncbi:MAG: hypothetical protein M1826_005082 [Phylliscum demangeonii]|nr:MAG: hypothetical protein M1826_005082 [Phylliscum demangeonii]